MRLLRIVALGLVINLVQSERIAVMYLIGSKSHFFGLKPVIELLADRGHEITVFSPFKGISNNIRNVREVQIEEVEHLMNRELNIDWFSMQTLGKYQYFQMMCHTTSIMARSTEIILRDSKFRHVIAEREVDLFIVDGYSNEYMYPIANLLAIPLITHLSGSPLPMILSVFGGPLDYASVPSPFTDFDDNMGFFQRLQNVVLSEILDLIRRQLMFSKLDAVVQKEFPNAVTISEAEKTISLTIVNSHPVTTFPRPLPPTIIPIGALHTRPAKALPKVLKTFADEAYNGLIVFSLGSFVPMSSMPNATLEIFTRVFSKLPQKIIWKWEGSVPYGVPSNVFMAEWIPQQDLLGHRNTRLFITHGGLLGTQEAIYHGVPLLSLPFGNDQRSNTVKARKEGYAIQLDWHHLDETKLLNAILYLLDDDGVNRNVVKASRLLRDEILPGKELAVYWIEYVLRHGSTDHLKLASTNLPFYKNYLLDIVGFLFIALLIAVYLTHRLVCYVLKRVVEPLNGNKKSN